MTYEQWENNWEDYYEILEVDRNASQNTIKKKYRKLMAKYHPDLHMNESEEEQKIAEEKSKKIGEAYEILSNPEKKKKYDAAWDEVKKTGSYTGQRQTVNNNGSTNSQNTNTSNTNSKNYTYEETKKEYTAEEKRYAKRLALKEVIKEELEKIDVIISAKNDLIYKGLSGEIDKREYYTSVKELMTIGYEFINNLKKLAEEAFKYDLLLEEEQIYDTIANLEETLNNIPLTLADAKRNNTEELYKEKIKEEVINIINNSKECIDKLNSILIYASRGEITYIDYFVILGNVLYEAKDCKSKLKEIINLAVANKLEYKNAIDTLKDLSSKIDLMPKDYETAKKLGSIEEIKINIKELLINSKQFENKMMRLLNVLKKHPNSVYYEQVCLTSLASIQENIKKLNEMKTKAEKPSNLEKFKLDKARTLTKQAVSLFQNASKLHQAADDTYSNKISLSNGYIGSRFLDDYLDEGVIVSLSKGAASILDKSKAFDIFVENEEIMEKLKNLNIKDHELVDLIKQMDDSIANLGRIIHTLKQFLEVYQTRQVQNAQVNNSNFSSMNINKISINELKDLLEKTKKELNIKMKKILSNALASLALGYYPTIKFLDGEPNTSFETMLSLILAFLTIGGVSNTLENFNDYLKLTENEKEISNELTKKLIKESNRHK